jgi:hypothetical protein
MNVKKWLGGEIVESGFSACSDIFSDSRGNQSETRWKKVAASH